MVTYRRQGCIDDGGIGHDAYWGAPIQRPLDTKATTDAGALRAARAWVDEENRQAKPCGSFACGNQGRVRLERVQFVVPEVRRTVMLRG